MGIGSDTDWERKMPSLDGVVALAYTDVHGFAHPFWLLLKTWFPAG